MSMSEWQMVGDKAQLDHWLIAGHDPDQLFLTSSFYKDFFYSDWANVVRYVKSFRNPMPDPEISLDDMEKAQEVINSLR